MVSTDPWFTPDGARWLMERAGASYGHCHPEERVEWVQQHFPEARLVLDLGCGDGSFLGAFPESYTLVGIEADSHLVQSGRKKFPHVRLIQNDLESPGSLPQADLVTLFHLLEHLSDPLEFLRTLKQRTGATTRLLIEVPILDRAIETHGPDICGFFSIPHRSHFSRQTLNRMLVEAGWQVEHASDLEGNGFRVLVSQKISEGSSEIDSVEVVAEKQLALTYVQCRQSSIGNVQKIIDALPCEGKFLIWGAGHHTEFLVQQTSLFLGNRQFLIVDNDPLKFGLRLHGIPILEPAMINSEHWHSGEFTVVISSYCWQEAIAQDLDRLGIDPSQVIKCYP